MGCTDYISDTANINGQIGGQKAEREQAQNTFQEQNSKCIAVMRGSQTVFVEWMLLCADEEDILNAL